MLSIVTVDPSSATGRYCTSTQADEVLYPHCPKEFREADYRLQMVAREIRGYGADLVMLQVRSQVPTWRACNAKNAPTIMGNPY